jgi:hypothetical protein
MFNVMFPDIKAEQTAIESEAQQRVKQIDAEALAALKAKGYNLSPHADYPELSGPVSEAETAAKAIVSEFSEDFGERTTARWWALFERIITKYRE